MAQLICIPNPFEPEKKERLDIQPRTGAYELLKNIDFDPEIYDLVIVKNQYIMSADFIVEENDIVIFTFVPHGGGGGGGGKNVIRVVAMIAVVVASVIFGPEVGAAMGITNATAAAAVGGAIITTAGSLLVNAVLPYTPATIGLNAGLSNIQNSNTYGWDDSKNVVPQGSAAPVLYGKLRITPPLIGSYIETVGNNQYLHTLYLVSDSAVDSIDSVWINNTPIEEFSGVTYEVRLGDINQSAIDGFQTTYYETTLGKYLSATNYAAQRTFGNDITSLSVNIEFPRGLYYFDANGNLQAQSVTLEIEYTPVGLSQWTPFPNTPATISDAVQGVKWSVFSATNLAPAQYDVRVKFTQTPPTGSLYATDCIFESLTEGIADVFTYPGRSLLAVRALATNQLSGSMPSVSCIASRGSQNPADGLIDILTNSFYGGGVDHSRLILDSFDELRDWCVSQQDYNMNAYFDTTMTLRAALDIVSALGRSCVVQYGSRFDVIIDKPNLLPTQGFTFGMGNIIEGSFQESWLPFTERANVVEVTYMDAELDYSKQIVTLYRDDYVLSNAVTKTSVNLIGCTSKTQAMRHGTYLLKQNRYVTLTNTIGVSIDAIQCKIGDIVNVSHDIPQWGYSGRLLDGCSQTTLYLDRIVPMDEGKTYSVIVRYSDDDTVEIAPVQNVNGNANTLTLLSTLPKAPEKYDNYSFGETSRVFKQFRVTAASLNNDLVGNLTLIEYVPEAYDDSVSVVDQTQISDLGIRGLVASDYISYAADGSSQDIVALSWRGTALSYQVYYRQTGTNDFTLSGVVYSQNATIVGLQKNITYDFKVIGGASLQTISYTVLAASFPPPDVASIRVENVDQPVKRLIWDYPNPPPDLAGFEIRKIRGESVDWENAARINTGVVLSSPFDIQLGGIQGAYTVMVKALNQSGVCSQTPAYAVFNEGDPYIYNLLAAYVFEPGFAGVLVNMENVSGILTCMLVERMWGDDETAPMWGNDMSAPMWGDSYPAASYTATFTPEVSGDAKVTLGCTGVANISYRPMSSGVMWGSDMSVPMWGDDETAPMWGTPEFLTYTGSFSVKPGQDYQIKIDFPPQSTQATIRSLQVKIDTGDITETLGSISIAAGGSVLPITKTYAAVKAINVTILGGSAIRASVSKNPSSPSVTLFDVSGNTVSGVIDAIVDGY